MSALIILVDVQGNVDEVRGSTPARILEHLDMVDPTVGDLDERDTWPEQATVFGVAAALGITYDHASMKVNLPVGSELDLTIRCVFGC